MPPLPHTVNWSPSQSTGPQTPFLTDISVRSLRSKKFKKTKCIFFWIMILGGPPLYPFGRFGPPRPCGGPRRAEEARHQAKVSGDQESSPGGPIGGCWNQICSPGALQGPPKSPKGTFWAWGPRRGLILGQSVW